MKKPKKQKKPSYKSLAFDLARAHSRSTQLECSNQMLRDDVRHLKAENEQLKSKLDEMCYVRENKMKQLGLYFAALNSLPGDHERLIQLQDELFDRTFETPSTNTL